MTDDESNVLRDKAYSAYCTIAAIMKAGIITALNQTLHSGRRMAPSLYGKNCSPNEKCHNTSDKMCGTIDILLVCCTCTCRIIEITLMPNAHRNRIIWFIAAIQREKSKSQSGFRTG